MYACGKNDYDLEKRELIVTDWFYQDLKSASHSCFASIFLSLIHYKKMLETVANEQVVSGQVHEAILEYASIFDEAIKTAMEIGDQYWALCDLFVSEVDVLDTFLYDHSNVSRVIRDFSNRQYMDILSLLDTKTEDAGNFLEKCINWVTSAVGYGIEEIGAFLDKASKNRSVYIAAVANFKECSGVELYDIFERVRACDLRYSSKFGAIYDELRIVYNIVHKANELLECNVLLKRDSVAGLRGMVDTLKEVKRITDIRLEIVPVCVPTIEQIRSFTNDFKNQHIFVDFLPKIAGFVEHIGAADVMFQAFQEGLDIITDHYIIPIPDGVPKNKRYEYVQLKKHLAEIIASLPDADAEASTEMRKKAKEIISAISSGEPLLANYGKYKSIYEAIYEILGSVGYGLDVSEIVASIFANYLENEKIIQSLAGKAEKGTLLDVAVQQLQTEYEDMFIRGLSYSINFITEEAFKMAVRKGSEKVVELVCNSSGGLFSLVNFGIKIVGEISGMGKSSESKLEFCVLFNSLDEIEEAYKKNFAIVASGSTDESDVLNLRNSFELLKNTYSKLYSLMGESVGATGDINQAAYYEYVAHRISQSSISTGICPVVSYDEFLANKY